MKTCPYCSEQIQNNAKKCKYCGELLYKENDSEINLTLENEVQKIKNKETNIQELPSIKIPNIWWWIWLGILFMVIWFNDIGSNIYNWLWELILGFNTILAWILHKKIKEKLLLWKDSILIIIIFLILIVNLLMFHFYIDNYYSFLMEHWWLALMPLSIVTMTYLVNYMEKRWLLKSFRKTKLFFSWLILYIIFTILLILYYRIFV